MKQRSKDREKFDEQKEKEQRWEWERAARAVEEQRGIRVEGELYPGMEDRRSLFIFCRVGLHVGIACGCTRGGWE